MVNEKTMKDVNIIIGKNQMTDKSVIIETEREKLAEALPEIIDYGLENGYVFDIITTDTPMVTHNILN